MKRNRAGWIGAALLFACGLALGTLVTRSPVQARMPGGRFPVSLPALLPFYAGALSFPLFLWLSRIAPLSRLNWKRALPLWLLTLALVSLVAEAILLVVLTRAGARMPPFAFLTVRLLSTSPLIVMSAAIALVVEAANARAELAQAQLRTVTSQLRPHFLFNTLQSISTLVHRDAAAADAMIGRLSDLLRASLVLDQSEVVTLREELDITSAYLAIVKERFGERLDSAIESDAQPELKVPPFLLQPLVENAIQHSVEASREQGRVRVHALQSGKTLILEVFNTPGGLPRNGTGLGLSSTRQRLATMYGDRASLELRSADQGTTVTIRLPAVL